MTQENPLGNPGNQRSPLDAVTPPTTMQEYRALYRSSIDDREAFWSGEARRIRWETTSETVVEENFTTAVMTWFAGGRLSASFNALDAQCEDGGDRRPALVFIDGGDERTLSYGGLRDEVRLLAGGLASRGLTRGDRVALYAPDSPETVIFMLACARLGVVYVPIPSRFTVEIAADIIRDCEASMLVVTTGGNDSYDARMTALLERIGDIDVVSTGEATREGVTDANELRSLGLGGNAAGDGVVDAEHPLFILYANSATGIPRGSVFATGGFLVQAVSSVAHTFQMGERPRVMCSAMSLASAAGQTYGLWGALASGWSVLMTRDTEDPGVERLRTVLEGHPGCALLVSPRLLAALKKEHGDTPICGDARFGLIACCGDVLSPRLVKYAGETLAEGPERVINLWVQSESGAAIIATFPHEGMNRPGSLGLPFFGVTPVIINHLGQKCRTNESGQLLFSSSWPGMIRTIWGQHERFTELYFRREPGFFHTNDGVRRDGEDFYWFMGRLDDVVKMRGQSFATSEVEAVIVSDPRVSEAVVVSIQTEEGENLTAFLVLEGISDSDAAGLGDELSRFIEQRIGEFAVPDAYIFTEELPRTRTGKVVRRLLRRIASGTIDNGEDLSHVANPGSVDKLLKKD